jgi:hypothetical protein
MNIDEIARLAGVQLKAKNGYLIAKIPMDRVSLSNWVSRRIELGWFSYGKHDRIIGCSYYERIKQEAEV